eukprot:5178248-Pleurochrysis_carterae.AAC.1
MVISSGVGTPTFTRNLLDQGLGGVGVFGGFELTGHALVCCQLPLCPGVLELPAECPLSQKVTPMTVYVEQHLLPHGGRCWLIGSLVPGPSHANWAGRAHHRAPGAVHNYLCALQKPGARGRASSSARSCICLRRARRGRLVDATAAAWRRRGRWRSGRHSQRTWCRG